MLQGVPPGASVIGDLDAAWAVGSPGPRLRALRAAAERLRDRFAAGPRAVAVRTLPIILSPYPTKHAFFGAAISPAPFVVFTHRCAVVQFLQRGELKTLLFNPTDVPGARSTPYFERLAAGVPERLQKLIAKEFEPLPEQLAKLGIRAEDVDYVAFDHLHVQDLRPILGTDDGRIAPRYPKAQLLVPEVEWNDLDDVHPMQRAWFVRDAKLGVKTERVVLTRGDLMLGDGVMLLRTPGHTSGNQTLFMSTSSGVWGISENGTCADNWSPMDSRIPGLRAFCRRQDVDVVLNANTPERGADQYTSMVLERTLVDRVARAPGFVQMFPSSEVTPSPVSPGLRPTILHRAIEHGSLAGMAGVAGVAGASSARSATPVASPSGSVRTWASPS